MRSQTAWAQVVLRLLLLFGLLASEARAAPSGVILPGREAEVLSLVQRALSAVGVSLAETEYGVRIEQGQIILRIRAATAVNLILNAPGVAQGDLAPGVSLQCFPAGTSLDVSLKRALPCGEAELTRWRPLGRALVAEQALQPELWVSTPDVGSREPSPAGTAWWALRSNTDVPWLRRLTQSALWCGLALSLLVGAARLARALRSGGKRPAPTTVEAEELTNPAPPLASSSAPLTTSESQGPATQATQATQATRPTPEREADAQRLSSHVTIGLALCCLVLIAYFGTSRMPLHEHLSYLARADCAYQLTCFDDPFGPGWSSSFFLHTGPLLHLIPYSVKGLTTLSLAFTVLAVLAGQAYLREVLRLAGYRASECIRAATLATAFICLNPLIIRVAIAGTFWPFLLFCLFGAGLALFEAARATGRVRRALAYFTATCLFTLAVNSNYVMLTLLPLLVLAPLCASPRSASPQGSSPRGSRLLSSPKRLALGAALVLPLVVLALSADTALEGYHAAQGQDGKLNLAQALYHPFVDPRLLPITLAPLLVLGAGAALRGRAGLPLVYAALATHPTLTTYGGHPLGHSYPVGFINAFFGLVLGSLLAAVGATLALRWLERWLTPKLATSALAVALLVPLLFATEGLHLLRGSRVIERELAAISERLPSLPPHDQLLYASLQEPLIPRSELSADPIQVAFPVGEYLTLHPGQRTPRGLDEAWGLDETWGRGEPSASPKRVLLYVGSPFYSFVRREIERGVVPESLERPSLTTLRQTHRLTPVSTFELSPEQHPLISSRLAADRRQVTVGFYWLEPK